MNEELQNALAEILTKTVDGMSAAGEFLQTEIPEVIVQLLRWHMAESLLFTAIWLISAWVCWGGFKKVASLDWSEAGESDQVVTICRGILSVTLLLPLGIEFGYAWLEILIAPKVYLIEYAANLAK